MYYMAKPCLYMYKTKYLVNIKSCALLVYSFIVFIYLNFILQKKTF